MSASRILIIEDDVWLGELFEQALARAGYVAVHSTNVLDAMDEIERALPDAIVLDVLLTATTAFTLLHELQSYTDTGAIPIVLCTNLAENVELNDVRPYGVRRILDKTTMEPADLVAAVRSVV